MASESGHSVTNGIKEGKKAHVLFVTMSYPGHFAPMVQLLYHLEAKYPGLTVTVWANKDRIADLHKVQRRGDLKDLDLRIEEVFGEVPVYLPDPKFPIRAGTTSPKYMEECQSAWKKLVAQKDSPGSPTAIVGDMFLPWSQELAEELGIPNYPYFSAGPSFLVQVVERYEMMEAGVDPSTSPNLDDLLEPTFPGLPSIRVRDLFTEIFHFEKYYSEMINYTKNSSAMLINLSEELDSKGGSVATVRKLWPSTRILCIGPSVQYPGFGRVYSSPESSSNCLKWLDVQPAKSVLYVAFGSLGVVSKDSVLELAAGLEASGVPFLWALRVKATVNLSEWLPEGFEERIKGQGIIETGWAPQVRILAHPSVGGFLSHSGWNSTLESMCAGVPLVSWPLAADQLMNARFIADVAKVGVEICAFKDEDLHSFENVTRQAVTKAVTQLMVEDKGDELRRNAGKVAKLLLADVEEGGASYHDLHLLLDELAGVRKVPLSSKADCVC